MNTVPIKNHCPKCAAPLPDDAPQGLCPKCLLLAASTPTETGAGPAGPANAPSLAAVQAAFPQLELIELIGAGGMGAVYKARQPKLDRFVALKVLSPSLAASPAFAERFNREARVLARLSHPGIVNVFDFGVVEQASSLSPAQDHTGKMPVPLYFLLMEFVDGVNLRQAMQAGRFTPAQSLALVPKICEALQFAHDEGILHRDIKPENILLDTKGRMKIADFGIAKLVSEPRPVTKLTATGAAIGTPQYMAPEQIEHPEDVDQRADIYSLGVVFYEMLTGELPIGRFPPPSEKSHVDARVDAVVFRTLEKERERRFGSAGEVKTSVEHLTAAPTAPTAPRAAAPAFDPTKDFILCPPQLPRMAKAIIVYTLAVAPVLWLLSCFMIGPLPDHPIVGFAQMAVNVLTYGLDFLLIILLAIGGWKLRGLRASAVNWLRTAIWLRMGFGLLSLGGLFWVASLESQLMPDAPVPMPPFSEGLMLAFGLAALVFEISALVWLHRHGAALRAVCEAAQSPSAPGKAGSKGWVFAGLGCLGLMLLVGLGGCLGLVGWFSLSPATTVTHAPEPAVVLANSSANDLTVEALAPPRENFIVTVSVLSNGVPVVSGRDLRAKLWPPSTREVNRYTIRWQATDEADAVAPWEIVVQEQPSGKIAARLRPANMPRLGWTACAEAADAGPRKVTHEAHTLELARARQSSGGGNAGVADWSVRVQLQSQPAQPTDARRGMEVDFVVPANQVAVFEVVTRSNGVLVPVSGLAAYQVNGANEPCRGRFLWADDPDDLDSQTALPRWSFGILGEGDRSLETGLGVPTPPSGYTGWLTLWTELKPDDERLEGLSNPDPERPAYGLRIRTQTVKTKPGLRYQGSGFGTNWMKEAASRLAGAEQ